MPTGLVKTRHDERLWENAKAQAREEYPEVTESSDRWWRIVNGIYQRMRGVEKAADVRAGLGRNRGNAAGAGPGGVCVCPQCGYRRPHEIGEPCYEESCPECGGLLVREVEAEEAEEIEKAPDEPPVGTGERFRRLRGKLARRDDVDDPDALAAWIGRKKYGKKRFQEMAAQGRSKVSKAIRPLLGPREIIDLLRRAALEVNRNGRVHG